MFYPLMIDLSNKKVVLIGGGKVSLRKTKKFLEYDAYVYIISPFIDNEFFNLKKQYNHLILIKDCYNERYIEDAFLVIAATNSKELNQSISLFCEKKNILCNVVDDMYKSSFIVPSTIKRGELLISISTLGNSPSLCSKIRKNLEKEYGDEYEEYVYILGQIRKLVLKSYSEDEKKKTLNYIVNLNLDELREFYNKLKKL